MTDNRLLPAAVFGGLLALGVIGGGALVGQGVIHARAGERVGTEGILELGDTTAMYAIAEIYETDIGRVKPGQRARISSPALSQSLAGEVVRIGLKIGKQDVLDADPVAKTDARVVEVEIRLDEGPDVSRLTNLQVRVEIGP